MGNWSAAAVQLDPIEFDGDKIVFTANRLKTTHIGVLLKHYDAERGTLVFSSQLEVIEAASQVLPEYIIGISGMTKGDGTEFSLEEFKNALGDFYFVPLVGEVLAGLVKASTVKALPAKK